jgi:hypothetical protein
MERQTRPRISPGEPELGLRQLDQFPNRLGLERILADGIMIGISVQDEERTSYSARMMSAGIRSKVLGNASGM